MNISVFDLCLLISSFSFFSCFRHHLTILSFPTRRSSDLGVEAAFAVEPHDLLLMGDDAGLDAGGPGRMGQQAATINLDRKSTRLNSSHANISYAVFCLKKKNN